MSQEKNLGWLIYAENDITEWYWLSKVRFIFAFWNGNLQNPTRISWRFFQIPISRSLCKAFWPDFGCWLPAKFLRVSLGTGYHVTESCKYVNHQKKKAGGTVPCHYFFMVSSIIQWLYQAQNPFSSVKKSIHFWEDLKGHCNCQTKLSTSRII